MPGSAFGRVIGGLSTIVRTRSEGRCRVLCVCGSETAAEKLGDALARQDSAGAVQFTRVRTILDGLGELARNSYNVIVAELGLLDAPGPNATNELQRCAPGVPLILVSSAADREAGVAAVRGGAQDFFTIENLDADAFKRSLRKALEAHANKPGADRRINARFPCRLAITWRTLDQPIKAGEVTTETVNISSKGILFAAAEQFEPGQLLQVSLDWPARLGNEIPLKLVAEGRVLRSSHGKTAMTIDRYEFRTRKVTHQAHAANTVQPRSPGRLSA